MNLLELPPRGPLPSNALSPPHVQFGINGSDVMQELPKRIPLNLVLHFAPKLRQWVLPQPEKLPLYAVRRALRTPYVGINILADIEMEGLKWIVIKMMQTAGVQFPPGIACYAPLSVMTAVSVHKAWFAFNLPVAGIQALHLDLEMRLMMQSSTVVYLTEIIAIWENFPQHSSIVYHMGLNFIRSHIAMKYSPQEFSAIRRWYMDSRDRTIFFISLESRFPEFGQTQSRIWKAAGAAALESATNPASFPTRKRSEILEKDKTRKVSPEERRARERVDAEELKKRLNRVKSDESIRSVETVIWDPQQDTAKEFGQKPIPNQNGENEQTDGSRENSACPRRDSIGRKKQGMMEKKTDARNFEEKVRTQAQPLLNYTDSAQNTSSETCYQGLWTDNQLSERSMIRMSPRAPINENQAPEDLFEIEALLPQGLAERVTRKKKRRSKRGRQASISEEREISDLQALMSQAFSDCYPDSSGESENGSESDTESERSDLLATLPPVFSKHQ